MENNYSPGTKSPSIAIDVTGRGLGTKFSLWEGPTIGNNGVMV